MRQRPVRQWRSNVMGFSGSIPFGDPMAAVSVPSAPPNTTSIAYSPSSLTLSIGVPMTPAVPTFTGGRPRLWQVLPVLPLGLALDPLTGTISGTPTVLQGFVAYTVTAVSSPFSRTTTLSIRVV